MRGVDVVEMLMVMEGGGNGRVLNDFQIENKSQNKHIF